ncbi:MAG: HAD family phosphatase [Chloroflexi bacterium]|nr:HAD family phosphatase [Chloroflexota bacterium]
MPRSEAVVPRFDAIVFDMDGVLLDSEPLHFAALATVLARDGVALSQSENEAFIGTTVETTFGTLIARYSLSRSLAEYTALYDAAVLDVLASPRPPAEGVEALIAAARDHGLRLGLASSSRRLWIDATLRSLGLSKAFDAIVAGDDVAHGKPDPEIYLLASNELGVAPARCLAIEDSPNGVTSARRAGMQLIGVRTPYTAHLTLDGVLQTVDSLAELDLVQTLTRVRPGQESNLRP